MTSRIDPIRIAGLPRPDTQDGVNRAKSRDAHERQSFEELFKSATDSQVQFSKHAAQRMEQRNIELSKDDLALLSDGINRAEQKGAKETLLLMDNTAYVVNVANRTVITAVDQQGMKDKTFTNIDSAIFL